MSWKDRAVKVSSSNSSWRDRAQPVIDMTEAPSEFESAARGAAQGASGNFADELYGAARGMYDDFSKMVTGGFDDAPKAEYDEFGRVSNLDEINKDITYAKHRDEYRADDKIAQEANPLSYGASQIAGSVLSPLNKVTKGMSLAKAGATLGGVNALGASEANNAVDIAADTALGAGGGALVGKLLDKTSPYISKGLNKAGNYFKNEAESLAENATGATRTQAEKFAPDAGRQLLDRGLVKFGDSAENIAQRTGQAMDDASANIDSALKALDAKGITASADNIVAELERKATDLAKDPSQAAVVRQIRGIIDDIVSTGESKPLLSAAEKTKRGFNKMARNWQDPDKGQAGKAAYLSYMDEVENAANAADKTLAAKFKEGKETFGLLAPMQEAAEKRAMTLNQSPFGGLLDMASAGSGGVLAGPGGSAAAIAGRRFIAPRVSSSLAVTADKISKSLMQSPQLATIAQKNPAAFNNLVSKISQQMETNIPRAAEQQDGPQKNNSYEKENIIKNVEGSKYAQILQNAAQRGDQAFGASHFVLLQKDPEYRKLVMGEQGQ